MNEPTTSKLTDGESSGSHASIGRLAYRLWQNRGRPTGTPEIDWFHAENEVREIASSETLPFSEFEMGPDTR